MARKFYLGIYERRRVRRYTLFRDGYKSHRGIDALPFSRLERSVEKPLNVSVMPDPCTLGYHLRTRRLKLGLLQKDVAHRIGTTEQTITNWEMTGHEPQIKYYPKIIEFLGFFPWQIDTGSLGGKIRKYRYMHGLTLSALARRLGIDHGTLIDCEGNKTKPSRRILEKLEQVLVTA